MTREGPMRYLAAALAVPLLAAPCLAVGGDAMASGLGLGGNVTTAERVTVALTILALVGGLADALLSPGDWAKPLALAAYGGVPFLATLLSEQVVGPGGPSFEHLVLLDPQRPAALAWASAVAAVGFAPGWVRAARRRGLRSAARSRAAAAGCGLAAAVLANAVVPTEGGNLGLGLVWLGVVTVVGAVGIVLAGVRVWLAWRRPPRPRELTA